MTENGLTVVQIKKVMKVLHPDLFIDSKIKSAVEYKQQQNRCRIEFIEGLYSRYESPETFKIFFRGIQIWASAINNQAYTISHVMGDVAAGITGAMCELPLARRLMCWAHVIRKVRGRGTLIKNKDKFLLVEQDIKQLQLSFSDQIFVTAANLMNNKWKLDKDLEKFTDYFEQQ
ncbi:unnamed protein product [Didymodactylos carnosus]|nr:unnamed protein product [Didymodactylos carnosus]CAF4326033.1 unnamed protein product [Didymodactylos carnosus]